MSADSILFYELSEELYTSYTEFNGTRKSYSATNVSLATILSVGLHNRGGQKGGHSHITYAKQLTFFNSPTPLLHFVHFVEPPSMRTHKFALPPI